jgi:Na+-transporting NADH:ubiquinone oxidoreductase subunit C
MSGKSKMKQGIYTVIFMVVITAICVAGVSWLHHKSLKKITMNNDMFAREAVLEAAGLLPKNRVNAEDISDIFQKNVIEKKLDDKVLYILKNGNYVIPVIGIGLWGKIYGVVGLENNLKILTGVSFIKNEETPGLGARITEKWFCRQFNGKEGPMTFIAEGTKGNDREFDGITGATITTRAVQEMVNRTLIDAPGIVREVNDG